MSYLIYMDVAGDVDPDFAAKNDVRYVPMEYSLGETMHTSFGPETPDFLRSFYNGQRNGDLTKTTQITPFHYEQVFEPVMKEGASILYLSLSSGLSSTYQSALLTASNLNDNDNGAELLVIDSLSATAGMGVILERAIRNREKGLSLHENAEDLLAMREKVSATFMVQDLDYLHRGGRVSATVKVVANALNLKPILTIAKDGTLDTIAKKRGNKMALNQLLEYFDSEHDFDNTEDPIYIVDSDAPDLSDFLYEAAKTRCPGVKIVRTFLSPIIGAHTGPGLGAIVHMRK